MVDAEHVNAARLAAPHGLGEAARPPRTSSASTPPPGTARPNMWWIEPFWKMPSVTTSRTNPCGSGMAEAMKANTSTSPSGVVP